MKEYKVMPTVPQKNIIWDILTETEVDRSMACYLYLSQAIEIEEWIKSFFNLYKLWLSEDDRSIYNIRNEVNMLMINSLVEINKKADFKLYYWFDVDRDRYPNFVWKKCPLTGTDLVDLPRHYHVNNRKLSVEYPLIFPGE